MCKDFMPTSGECRDNKDYYRHMGRHYGYPERDIEFFIAAVVDNEGDPKYIKRLKLSPFYGTGFVPGPQSLSMAPEDLLAEISRNRQCPKPFKLRGYNND